MGGKYLRELLKQARVNLGNYSEITEVLRINQTVDRLNLFAIMEDKGKFCNGLGKDKILDAGYEDTQGAGKGIGH